MPVSGRKTLSSAIIITLGSLLLSPLTACVSKSKAAAQARAAFFAGQQQALETFKQAQAGGPTVVFMGPVRNHVVPWTADMTLARALVTADYVGGADPKEITIVRGGAEIREDPQKLLSGEDVPLQAGDVIQLK